jgi:hypothetical protein
VAVLLVVCAGTTPTGSRAMGATELRFEHRVVDANPPSGDGCCLDVCALGDLDGDGRIDIVVGSQNSVGMVWYHNPDWKRYPIGPGEFTTDAEIADLNGDGRAEIIASDVHRDQIEWYERVGDPFHAEGWKRHRIGGGWAHDLAVGDINGDGRLDVIAFSKYVTPPHLAWYQAPADPRGEWARHEIDQPAGEGLDVGDLDGDGHLDIAAGRCWYRNTDGHGLKWDKREVVSDWTDDCRVVIADMNGDGKPDIVLSYSEGKGRLSWFENPTWRERLINAGPLEGVHSLGVADFDGDGRLEVMAGEMHTSPGKGVMVCRRGPTGEQWQRLVLATTGTHNAQVGRLTPGGLPAIVGKNYDGPKQVEIWQAAVGRGTGSEKGRHR